MSVGKKIQALRKEQGLTQKELGSLLGISGSMIGQYENDLRNPKIETLLRIAKVLSVSPESLMEKELENEVTTNRLVHDDGSCTAGEHIEAVLKKHASFYEIFCSVCKERKISPSAAAHKAGLDKSIVSYWGKNPATIPKYENLLRISKVLSVSPEYLMGHEVESVNAPSKSVSLSTWQKELELIHVELMKLWSTYSELGAKLLELLELQRTILKKGRSP